MPETVTNDLTCRTLRRIQNTLALHTQYHLASKERLSFIEHQSASISCRVDGIDEQLERVEKRLGLIEA